MPRPDQYCDVSTTLAMPLAEAYEPPSRLTIRERCDELITYFKGLLPDDPDVLQPSYTDNDIEREQ